MLDFSVAQNWTPSSPQLFRAAEAVRAGSLGAGNSAKQLYTGNEEL